MGTMEKEKRLNLRPRGEQFAWLEKAAAEKGLKPTTWAMSVVLMAAAQELGMTVGAMLGGDDG